ncbi:hypothetical protein G9A89_000956 [Geosiphon pyriformis]|nr:hypothetical protein G9A89_000956 [Geosiphon pyriformis]
MVSQKPWEEEVYRIPIDGRNEYVLVLEYGNGGTLRQYLKSNFSQMNGAEKLRLAKELAQGIDCLHQENIIHRDLVKIEWQSGPSFQGNIESEETFSVTDFSTPNFNHENSFSFSDELYNSSEIIEEPFIVIKKSLPNNDYSKVVDAVRKYLERNETIPEEFFICANNNTVKSSIRYILLGVSLEHGIGTNVESTKAFLKFEKAANMEDPLGQFFLGRCYFDGIGIYQDKVKAFELLSKAAEAGTTKNLEKAFELYSKAAEVGNTNTQYNLATCYRNGRRTTKAAEAGHLKAQYNLALCYQNGRETTKNPEKGFELYSKAAEAILHIEKAFVLYLKAVEAGHISAQNDLSKNDEKAFELYSKAEEAQDCFNNNNLINYTCSRQQQSGELIHLSQAKELSTITLSQRNHKTKPLLVHLQLQK